MSKTVTALLTIASVFVVAFLLVLGLFAFGWADINWPWEGIDVVQEELEVEVDIEEGPAELIKISPIALDCRARVIAEVPVIGTRTTEFAGATVSTDTVRMRAVGDVDTCVDAGGVEIHERADGTFGVVIDASTITFSRPRVDAVATMNSVITDRGFVGQLVEALPWTDENDELTPAAFAFAQSIIGGSTCMQAAYDQTTALLVASYEEQIVEQGRSPGDVDVIISGTPNFNQNELPASTFGEFEFAEEAGTSCIVQR